MPKLISGYLEKPSKIIMFDETDYSIEYSATLSGGAFEINNVIDSKKLIMARALSDGETIAYGNVTPHTWGYDLPTGAYAHYIGDNIVSVDSWPDEMGNADLTTRTGTLSILDNAVNGHKAMRFDASGSYIRSAIIDAIPASMTIVFVMRKPSTINGTVFSIGPRNIDKQSWFWNDLGGGQIRFVAFNDGYAATCAAAEMVVNQWQIFSVQYDNTPNWLLGSYTGRIRENGEDVGYGTATAYRSDGQHDIRLGYDYEMQPDLDIAEFIYYQGVLSDSDLTSLENYLKEKYGIS